MSIWNKIKSLLIIGLASCYAGTVTKSKKEFLELTDIYTIANGRTLSLTNKTSKKVLVIFCNAFRPGKYPRPEEEGKLKLELKIYDGKSDEIEKILTQLRRSFTGSFVMFLIDVDANGKLTIVDQLAYAWATNQTDDTTITKVKFSPLWRTLDLKKEVIETKVNERAMILTLHNTQTASDFNVAVFLNTDVRDHELTQNPIFYLAGKWHYGFDSINGHIFKQDPDCVPTEYSPNYCLSIQTSKDEETKLVREIRRTEAKKYEVVGLKLDPTITKKQIGLHYGNLNLQLDRGNIKSVEYVNKINRADYVNRKLDKTEMNEWIEADFKY